VEKNGCKARINQLGSASLNIYNASEWPRAKPPAGGPFKLALPPRQLPPGLVTKNIRLELESAGPVDAAGAFLILVTRPDIIYIYFLKWLETTHRCNEHSEKARAPHTQTDRGTCPGVGL
jgi:hypothetical protein